MTGGKVTEPPTCDWCQNPMPLITDTVDARGVRLLLWFCDTCGDGDGESYVASVGVSKVPKL